MSSYHLYKNSLRALIEHGKIKTTKARAKVIRGLVDKVITRAKKGGVPRTEIERLAKKIAPRFKDRNSGFTRIIKLGTKVGNNAPMVLMEFVEGTSASQGSSMSSVVVRKTSEKDKRKR